MSDGMNGLQTDLRQVQATLESMEGQLRSTQAEVQGLGFFARSFVEKDISGATGRGFGDWISAAASLRTVIGTVADGRDAGAVARARQAISDELPRLASLRAYLQRAPQKVNMVPAAVLKPQQRAGFLEQVRQQEQALSTLETQLSKLSQSLTRLG